MIETLKRIKSEDFIISLGYNLPPHAMRKLLIRTDEHERFCQEYGFGSITDDILRNYVSELMQEFSVGSKFPYDATLAFIAVCLESSSSTLAKEFLSDLSKLKLSEMSLCINVAKISLMENRKLPQLKSKEFIYSRESPPESHMDRPYVSAGSSPVVMPPGTVFKEHPLAA